MDNPRSQTSQISDVTFVPSPYNKFMKEEIPKYKKAHPSASHAQTFAHVAKQWAKSSKNPKNA